MSPASALLLLAACLLTFDLNRTLSKSATNADGETTGNFTDAMGVNGSLSRMTTPEWDKNTTSACFARNHKTSKSGNASEDNCDGGVDNADTVDSYMAFLIGVGINRYVLPVIIIVGSFGNLVSMCVMFQRQNRYTSFSIYLGCLAISDNCVLYGAAYYWVVSEIQARSFLDVECKILNWMLDVFQQNGVLLILSVTLDRLVAVRYPLKAAAWCRAKRAKIVSACVFAAVATYNIPHLVLNKSDVQFVCKLCSFDNIICIIHSWVTAFMAFALPFVLLLAMNTVIIRVVRNAIKYKPGDTSDNDTTTTTTTTDFIEVSELSGQDSTQSAQQERPRQRSKNQLSSKDRNLIAMLLLVSFMFLFLNAPRFIRIILFFTVHVEPTTRGMATSILVFHITNKLYFFNNACNFFLYCVSGTKFRRDFAKLIHEHCWQRFCKRTKTETSIPS